MNGDGLLAMEEAIRELNERIATVHERVECPKCCAAVGQECANLRGGAALKHPHAERIRAAGIPLR